MTLRPHLGESTDSYIRRLARANHLTPSYLHGFLCGPPNWFGKPRLLRLAAVTGHSPDALQYTLADASSPRRRRKPAPTQSGWPTELAKRLRAVREEAATNALPVPLLAQRHGIDRHTIRLALTRDLPPTRSEPRAPHPVLAEIQPLIEPMANRGLPARKIWTQLLNEHDVSVSLSTIIIYLRARGR